MTTPDDDDDHHVCTECQQPCTTTCPDCGAGLCHEMECRLKHAVDCGIE